MVSVNFSKRDLKWMVPLVLVLVIGFGVALNSGDYLIHGHDASELNISVVENSGVIETGVLNHGAIIPIPVGYVATDCKWIVSLENIQAVGTVNSDDTLGVWVGSDRKVHVGDWDVSSDYKTVEPGDTTGDVNYMIICGKVSVAGNEFVPTSYFGGESVTFPNGMIMKTGTTSSIAIGSSEAVVFLSSFPDSVSSISITRIEASGANSYSYSVGSISKNGFTLYSNGARAGGYYWTAIGY